MVRLLYWYNHGHIFNITEGVNPFPDDESGRAACYLLAMFRNLFAQADFATMGRISKIISSN